MTAACCAILTTAHAQRHEIFSDDIQSLQVIANGNWLGMPVVTLGNGNLYIAFDDLTHEYRRYQYRIEHCEADWTLSDELFPSDYVNGFADTNPIDDVQESLLTNVLYTHYSLQLPNEHCQIKMGGNYRLTVYDDNNDREPVLTACFMVVEPKMGLSLDVTTNTDLSINRSHQQVSMSLDYGGLPVTFPEQQIKTVVLQNGRWDDARWCPRPQYTHADGLQWTHNRDLIFDAGNEYRKFEILSTDVASMGIEKIRWDGEEFHAYPFPSTPRPNYLYDEDANGAFLIRNSDNIDADFTSDYMTVHFRLDVPGRLPGDVYLNANWTLDRFLPQYQMEYNEQQKAYEGAVRLKLGYYSYQYLMLDADGHPHPVPSEGNFYQTENNYQALVYYRERGGRTDRLVGFAEVTKSR